MPQILPAGGRHLRVQQLRRVGQHPFRRGSVSDGDRIGFFSYGSGAIGEFYSGRILPGARDRVREMNFDGALGSRTVVSVADYENAERIREGYIENP
ncbi:MAG TPA: hypothetical protein ENN69_02825, partial [Spirochaetia bacterium]|nr:hypothetical protein [Spirochaetia bacterium]